MPRARNLKPGFFKNEDLVELPFEDRLLFAGLWTLADRRGVLEDRPKRIKMEVFPADNVDVDESLSRLADRGLLIRYDANGTRAIFIPAFARHQNPHKNEGSSAIPLPAECSQGVDSRDAPEQHGASTVQAPEEYRSAPAESLLLNPESPPSEGASAPSEAKDVVFREGLALLTGAGRSERSARSHLGKLCKAHGDEAVATAVRQTARASPVDPAPYLERLCRGESGKQAVEAMTGGVSWS